MNSCKYTTKYFDYNKKEPAIFKCNEEALQSGFCIFHDEKFENDEELVKQLTQKINERDKKTGLFCIGYKIPNITLNDSVSGPVYFTRSSIENADFSGAKFENADFSGAKFEDVSFAGAQFENADFLAVKFNGKTNFSNTVFKNKVNFSESFFDDANFNGSSLNKAQFIGTKFQTADFGLAKLVDCDFFGAIFENETSFIGADLKRCKFPKAKFQSITNFTGAKLNKTNFPQSTFKGVNFDNAILQVVVLQNTVFQGNANFSLAELEKVDFFKANFKKNINFSESKLQQVTFSEVSLIGAANFTKATFQDEVKFNKLEINQADFSNAKFAGKTFFHSVLFKDQGKIIFDVDDLSKVSFRNTDLTKVRFSEKVRWAGKNGFSIIDEKSLEESPDQENLQSVIATYRGLRKNYENRLRYEEADKFLEREIELKNKYKQNEPHLNISNLDILQNKIDNLKEERDKLLKKVKELENKFNEKNIEASKSE